VSERTGDGAYAMMIHGRPARPLTEAEYRRQRAYHARGFSGH
jgi:hypothetical protein